MKDRVNERTDGPELPTLRERLREGIPIRRNARRLIMVCVMVAFAGLYWVAGPAHAEPDPSGSETGAAPTAICSEVVDISESATDDEKAAILEECKVANAGALANATEKNRVAVNLVWLIVAGALVFFMQAGFAMVETGFCRGKNAAHVVMTNYMVFGLATIAFAVVGYGFMFGGLADLPIIGFKQFGSSIPGAADSWHIWSYGGWALEGSANDVGVLAFFFFQLVFMDTMATIPTGAMAERWKFSAFCVFAVVAGAIIYPIIGNWVWGGGWLSQLGAKASLGHGAIDFAGSGVVHAVGGVTGLMGAIVLGPRIGKFNKDGSANALPAHNIPMGIFGTIILFFGWIGFNGGSTFAASDFRFTAVIVNTILAGSVGAVVAMLIVKSKWGKFDPSMAANGGLAGLVAITAPCAFVSPFFAMLIGAIAAVILVVSVSTIEKLKIDDPVGAVSVHGACGIWGVLALGLFANGTYGDGWGGVPGTVEGLFFGDGGQFLAQVIYAVTLIVVISAVTYTFFRIQDKVQGIRVGEDEEIQGVDIPEMGVEAYPRELDISRGTYAPPASGVKVGDLATESS